MHGCDGSVQDPHHADQFGVLTSPTPTTWSVSPSGSKFPNNGGRLDWVNTDFDKLINEATRPKPTWISAIRLSRPRRSSCWRIVAA